MPETSGTLRRRRAELPDVERQDRPEAAIHELEPEDHAHQQHEILERQDVAEGDALGGARRSPAPVHRRLVVQEEDEHAAR